MSAPDLKTPTHDGEGEVLRFLTALGLVFVLAHLARVTSSVLTYRFRAMSQRSHLCMSGPLRLKEIFDAGWAFVATPGRIHTERSHLIYIGLPLIETARSLNAKRWGKINALARA